MNKSNEDEEDNNWRKLKSQSFTTLKTLERVGSSESVQLWIDSLTDDDWNSSTEERKVLPGNDSANFGSVEYLLVPGVGDDELWLGADARSLSCEETELSISPRLSPLAVDNDEVEFHYCNNSSNCPEDARLKQVDQKDIDDDEKRSTATDKRSDLQNNDVRRGGLASKRQDSLLSSQSVSSLLAAMETDPEDLLISLGFCDEMSSPIHRIPLRFLTNPSQAKGIDVKEFCHRFMDFDSEDSGTNIADERRGSLANRFSQSSIDLSLVDYSDSIVAKLRRAKFRQSSIPSITICDENENDESASDKTSQARLSGHLRLSTVVEEYEPSSRKSSFSRSFSGDKKTPLQKQVRVDEERGSKSMDSVFDFVDFPENTDIVKDDVNDYSLTGAEFGCHEKEQLLPSLTEKQHGKVPCLLISDNNNNCDISYVESISHFSATQYNENEDQNALRGSIDGLSNSKELGDVTKEQSDLYLCRKEGGIPMIEGEGFDMDSLKSSEMETAHTESQCSFPDSIENETNLEQDCPLLNISEKQEPIRQFSDDSLEGSISENGSSCEKSAEDIGKREDDVFSDLSPSRIVYRSLGKVENLKTTTNLSEESDEILGNGSLQNLKSGRETSFTSYFSFLNNENVKSEDKFSEPAGDDFSQSCNVENVSKKRSSSRIRDYFRKLANGTNRRFFSLESLNTIGSREKFQSHEDLLFRNESANAVPNTIFKRDDGLGIYDKPNSGSGNRLRKLLNLGNFSSRTNVSSELMREGNLEHENLTSSSFGGNDAMTGKFSKLVDSKIVSNAERDSPKNEINGDGELIDRHKRKMIPRGCSIESSGFEEENEIYKSSPERGCKLPPERGWRYPHERDDRRLCEHCTTWSAKQTILEASLSIPDQEDSHNDSNTTSNIATNANLNLTSDRFDYLVVQMTSLRQEICEQEERLKSYIDDSMEKIKASILTEISILNASYKTGSSDLSMNIDH